MDQGCQGIKECMILLTFTSWAQDGCHSCGHHIHSSWRRKEEEGSGGGKVHASCLRSMFAKGDMYSVSFHLTGEKVLDQSHLVQ